MIEELESIIALKAELGLDPRLQIRTTASLSAHYWALSGRGVNGAQYVPQADYIKAQQRLWGGNVHAWEQDMLTLIKRETGHSYHYLLANNPPPLHPSYEEIHSSKTASL